MTNLEQVEKLRERTNLSYEEAKKVLDEVDGDILEALMKLEKEGKVKSPEKGSYSSAQKEEEFHQEKKQYYTPPDNDGVRFSQVLKKIGRFCGKILKKGNTNFLEVRRFDHTIIQLPLTVVALLVIIAFWAVIPLMIIGLFFNCRYVFVGKDIETTSANKAMNKVADTADNIKTEVMKDDEVNNKE